MSRLRTFGFCVLTALALGGGCTSSRWNLNPNNPTTDAPKCNELPLSLKRRAALGGPRSQAGLLEAHRDAATLTLRALSAQVEATKTERAVAEKRLTRATARLARARRRAQIAEAARRRALRSISQAKRTIRELAGTTQPPAELKKAAAAQKALDAARLTEPASSSAFRASRTRLKNALGGFHEAKKRLSETEATLKQLEQDLMQKQAELLDPLAELESPILCVGDSDESATRLRLLQLNPKQDDFNCVRVRSANADVLGFADAGDTPDRRKLDLRPLGGGVEFLLSNQTGDQLSTDSANNALNQVFATAPKLNELTLELFGAECKNLCELAQPKVTLRFKAGVAQPQLETRNEDTACPLALSRAAARDGSEPDARKAGAGGAGGSAEAGNGGASDDAGGAGGNAGDSAGAGGAAGAGGSP